MLKRLVTLPLFAGFALLNVYWYKHHSSLDIYQQMFIVISSVVVYFVASAIEVFYAKNKKTRKIIFTILVTFLIAYYCVFLSTVLFLDGYFFKRANTSSINKIPLKTIKRFYRVMKERNDLRAFANLMGNAILFAPFGILLPLWHKYFRKTVIFVPFITMLVVGAEYLQYRFKIGGADIDDVILNVLGAVVAFVLFKFMYFIAKERIEVLFKND